MHRFAVESFTPDLVRECAEMIRAQHEEVSDLAALPLDPDFHKYASLDAGDCLRIFTARTEAGQLIGFDVFIVSTMLHHSGVRCASQDLVYITPEHRGFGREFLRWCDGKLQSEGVQLVARTLKPSHPFENAMAGEGYLVGEISFVKRFNGLDHEVAT